MHFQPLPPHCLWMLNRSLTPQPTGWRYHSIWFAMCGDVFYKNFYVSFWVFIFSNLCDKFAIASHKHTQRITVHASQWRVESLWCVCVCVLWTGPGQVLVFFTSIHRLAREICSTCARYAWNKLQMIRIQCAENRREDQQHFRDLLLMWKIRTELMTRLAIAYN